MLSLSIKSVPDPLAESLRRRAARNHRSLQGELMAILEAAVADEAPAPVTPAARGTAAGRSFAEAATAFRQRFTEPLGGSLESATLLRELRDQRNQPEAAA